MGISTVEKSKQAEGTETPALGGEFLILNRAVGKESYRTRWYLNRNLKNVRGCGERTFQANTKENRKCKGPGVGLRCDQSRVGKKSGGR